jgi:cation diffusion facilitator CzcD-associated flavoprotein CzcO
MSRRIFNYLISVVNTYELYKYVRFNTTVERAQWNDDETTWKIRVEVAGGKGAEYGDSYTISSDYLFSAGQLN